MLNRIEGNGVRLRDGPNCDSIVRVYRPAESVFAGDAWHAYAHVPVTLEHPRSRFDSANWKQYAVGETLKRGVFERSMEIRSFN